MNHPFKVNRKNHRIIAIWTYLHERGDATAADMAADMGVTQNALGKSIKVIRTKYPGVVRVSGWHRYNYEYAGSRGRGMPAPVYSLSPGDDVRKPKRIPKAVADRAAYERAKALTLTKRRANNHGSTTVDTFAWLVKTQLGK